MSFVRACGVNDIKPNHGKPVNIDGVEIALFNLNGQFYAIDNTCPHRHGPLGDGMIDDGEVTCPLHGWRFDIRTGKGVFMPVSVRTFDVRVEGHDVLVDL